MIRECSIMIKLLEELGEVVPYRLSELVGNVSSVLGRERLFSSSRISSGPLYLICHPPHIRLEGCLGAVVALCEMKKAGTCSLN